MPKRIAAAVRVIPYRTWHAVLREDAHRACWIMHGRIYLADNAPYGHHLPFPGEPPHFLDCRCLLLRCELPLTAKNRLRWESWVAGQFDDVMKWLINLSDAQLKRRLGEIGVSNIAEAEEWLRSVSGKPWLSGSTR